MTTPKRTAPLLAMALIATAVAVSPAFATKGAASDIPEWITVSAMTVKTTEAETTITVKGDFPPNYLTYRPAMDQLIVEVRDCDASRLDIPSLADSKQVKTLETETETDADGTLLATVPVRDRKFEAPASRADGDGVTFSLPPETLGAVVTLDGGRFLTCLGKVGTDDTWSVELDLWSPGGEHLEALHPDGAVRPLAFRDGMLYASEVREEIPVVVRYAVHWDPRH